MSAKVPLQPTGCPTVYDGTPHITRQHLTAALPYVQIQPHNYVHRVRAGDHIYLHGHYHRTALRFWCGNQGGVGGRNDPARFYAMPPVGSVVCATCEGRAIGAGLTATPIINGHPVRFSPRSRS